MNNLNKEELVSSAEICKYLSISTKALYKFIHKDKLPAKKTGNRWIAKKTDIDEWIKAKNVPCENISYRHLSLFSGCGGLDLGIEGDFAVLQNSINHNINPHWQTVKLDKHWAKLPKTKFNTVFANDIKLDAKATWDNFFSKKDKISNYYVESIVDLVKKHKENKKIFPLNVDLVTGGFPCQDFSIAGKRKGFDSTKSHKGGNVLIENPTEESRGLLYMWLREVISIVQPKMFIAENVKGLINLSNVKEIIEKDFSTVCDSGYLIVPAILLHAANYGVPQNRERIIFYGFKKSALKNEAFEELSKSTISDFYSPYPVPTHAFGEYRIHDDNRLKPVVTLNMAFLGLEEPNNTLDIAQTKYSKAKFMGKHCQGQTEIQLNSISPTIRSEHHGNIEFRRLSLEHGGKNKEELEHGLKERRLTIRECARIQTFPDDYEFIIPAKSNNVSVSASAAYKLIGNAVPPLLGFHIAKRIEDNWDKYFK